MKRILISMAAVGALLATFVFAFGDIARPKPTTPTEPHGQIIRQQRADHHVGQQNLGRETANPGRNS